MKTKEILSIAALAAIALCLICGVAKMTMKSTKQKQSCDTACSLLVFVAVVLVGISQLLDVTAGEMFGAKPIPGTGPCSGLYINSLYYKVPNMGCKDNTHGYAKGTLYKDEKCTTECLVK